MKLRFTDQTFSFELLRTASYGSYGGSEIGEVLATAEKIREGDFESWYIAWQIDHFLFCYLFDLGFRYRADLGFIRRSRSLRDSRSFS